MPSHLVEKSLAAAGQSSLLDQREQLLYNFFLACVALTAAIIFLFLLRRWMGFKRPYKGLDPPLDIGSLKEMQQKGLLTDEETRRVREAVVRQALRKDELLAEAESLPNSLNGDPDLIKSTPRSKEAGHAPDNAEAKTVEMSENSDFKKSSNPLDMEKLLAKGLISKEEYDRLRKHFSAVK